MIATIPNHRAATVVTPRSYRRLIFLHVITLVLFAGALFWNLHGKTPINADDINIIFCHLPQRLSEQYDFLRYTQSRLHLILIYIANYRLAGGSCQLGNFIWYGLYLLAVSGCYLYLRGLFAPAIALAGALFYLCYSCKFEPLTWWSSGAYTVVWALMFPLLMLIDSRLSERWKPAVCGGLLWITLQVYEVLSLVAPILSVLFLLRAKRQHRLDLGQAVLCLLPVLAVAVHVTLLSTADAPIYRLRAGEGVKSPSVAVRIGSGILSAIDKTVGPRHFAMASKAQYSFAFYSRENKILRWLFFLAVAVGVISILISLPATMEFHAQRATVIEHMFLGLGMLALSAAVGCISNVCDTPSRLTGVPAAGLVIVLCALLQIALCYTRRMGGKWRSAALCLFGLSGLFAWSIFEFQAFAGNLRQAEEVYDFDLRLAKKIHQLHPVLGEKEQIFVRMPLSIRERQGVWTSFWSQFNTGRAFETLSYLYGKLPDPYCYATSPFGDPGEYFRMRENIKQWQQRGSDIVPFQIDPWNNVRAVTAIEFYDDRRKLVERWQYARKHATVPAGEGVVERYGAVCLPNRKCGP